jgi:putative Holliday junction resolvase
VRALGVDVGTARVGLALSDPDGLVATPLTTLTFDLPRDPSSGLPADLEQWATAVAVQVARSAGEHACHAVVVGLPRALSGRETASTALARAVVVALRDQGVTVETWDERLTSVQAQRSRPAGGGGRRRERERGTRDRLAAAIILQGWLDARRARA